ncbi:MAG: PIN domain nuclease [Nitrospirae bacterium]|nr:PIN domain nuclease [Nitrospirota bacterium]MBI3378604.1 PIN domain nuclease [Nitrospirota bacterium]
MQASAHLRKLAADANVILSAVAGKAALRIFLIEEIEVVTAQFNIDEVREYLGVIAEQYSLSEEILESQLKLLPLKIYPKHFYEDFIPKAAKKMSGRDEDDVELLALAMKLNVPVWSNDGDFKGSGVELYTTAKLLKILKA